MEPGAGCTSAAPPGDESMTKPPEPWPMLPGCVTMDRCLSRQPNAHAPIGPARKPARRCPSAQPAVPSSSSAAASVTTGRARGCVGPAGSRPWRARLPRPSASDAMPQATPIAADSRCARPWHGCGNGTARTRATRRPAEDGSVATLERVAASRVLRLGDPLTPMAQNASNVARALGISRATAGRLFQEPMEVGQ